MNIERLLRVPLSWFESSLTGRVLNRFSKHIDGLDFFFAFSVRTIFLNVGQILAVLIIIGYASKWLFLLILPVLIGFFIGLIFVLSTTRQLKRLESITRSPVYSNIVETFYGI